MSLLQNGYYLYSVSASEYFNRAQQNIDIAKEHRHYLFYAALETRFLIETILREYLVTVKELGSSRAASKKYYKPTSIKREIKSTAPDFADKVRFANVLLQSNGSAAQMPIPDWNVFLRHYKTLHDYLHTQHLPTYLIESEWWEQFETKLMGVLQFTRPFLQMPKIRVICNDAGLALFHRFRHGELSPESLMEIVRNKRFEAAEIRLEFRQFPQE